MPCRRLLLLATFGAILALTLAVLANVLHAHGVFEKVLWGDKANYATRGAGPGTQATKLYYMQPPEFMTGDHQTVGWRLTLQDADASTAESVRLSWVKFANDGKSPDTSSQGEIFALTVMLFGRGLKGNIAYDFTVSIGVPQPLPSTVGIGIEIAGNANWPADGASIHAQLNKPNDARRPRILPPYDKEVWCYETTSSNLVVPLGGRTLDTLHIGGLYIEPTITPFIDTTAYGSTRPERIYGADALFPNANRADDFGLQIDGGQVGSNGFAILYVAKSLNPNPVRLFVGEFRLSLVAPEPHQILLTTLDGLGSTTVGPHPFYNLPIGYREFWLQALILSPFSFELEATDAIKIRGQ